MQEDMRQRWIELNAERIIRDDLKLTYWNANTRQHEPAYRARHPHTYQEALELSQYQLEYDEEHRLAPRYSLDDLTRNKDL